MVSQCLFCPEALVTVPFLSPSPSGGLNGCFRDWEHLVKTFPVWLHFVFFSSSLNQHPVSRLEVMVRNLNKRSLDNKSFSSLSDLTSVQCCVMPEQLSLVFLGFFFLPMGSSLDSGQHLSLESDHCSPVTGPHILGFRSLLATFWLFG